VSVCVDVAGASACRCGVSSLVVSEPLLAAGVVHRRNREVTLAVFDVAVRRSL